MKFGKAECAAILVTITLLSFAAGFFFGRSTVPSTLQVERAVPAESPYRAPVESDAEVSANKPEKAEDAPSGNAPAEGDPQPQEEVEFPIDLNSAGLSELEALPEIGPVLAQRILDYRETCGAFTSVEELKNVSGIGEKTYDAIKNLVKVVK